MTYKRPRCTCPDATNRRAALIGSPFFSELFEADWSENFNGIRSRGGYCIHEIAVIMYRKEEKLAFPDGIPYEPPIDSRLIAESKTYQLFDSDFTYV